MSFDLRLLITALVSSNFWPVHCLSFFDFWLLLWYLRAFSHWVVCTSLIYASDYSFDIFKHLAIIFVCPASIYVSDYTFDIFKHLAIALSVLLFTTYDYSFGIFKYLTITLSVLRFAASDYPFGNLKLFLYIVFVHNNLDSPFIWRHASCTRGTRSCLYTAGI